jgi:hypothetical protein
MLRRARRRSAAGFARASDRERLSAVSREPRDLGRVIDRLPIQRRPRGRARRTSGDRQSPGRSRGLASGATTDRRLADQLIDLAALAEASRASRCRVSSASATWLMGSSAP